MKTLEDIKNEVAKEKWGLQWDEVSSAKEHYIWPEVCHRACEESVKASLKKAAEKAEILFAYSDENEIEGASIYKPSITDPSNIIIVK